MMQGYYDDFPRDQLYWPDHHYASLLQAYANNTSTWEYDDRIDLIARAAEYYWCTYMPRRLSDTPATQYVLALADKDVRRLEPGKTYKIDVPANMPVKQFWALTVYDHATMSFIYTDLERTTLSSYDLASMQKNPDGAVTIHASLQVLD